MSHDWKALIGALQASPPEDFAGRWRLLGRHGVFEPLRRRETLVEGCAQLERLAYDLDSLGVFISIISGCGLALPILDAVSDHGPHAELCDAIVSGRSVAAVAITEPGAGSDVFGMTTSLCGTPGALRLRGRKWCITNAPVADHIIVFCRNVTTHEHYLTAVLVPREAPGVVVSPPLKLAGVQGSPTGEISFSDVEIRETWVLGPPERGKLLLDLAFARERILAPWPLIGKMSRVLQDALDHVEARRQFGKPIKEFQYVQDKIVGAFETLETTRLLAAETLRRYASAGSAHLHASLAKYHAAEGAAAVFKTMIEVHGSHGLVSEARLAQHLIDAMCAAMAGGTRESHKRVVFDQLVRDRARARRTGRSRVFTTTHARARDGERHA